ncbi:hypothetical protein BN59_01829 [Legionella massiliensis]|uniref:Uncharacterized protein n=1 Tax=Legionella massiliensis TaxID=1034943 RepID=A0A078KX52_9GAMM|nr:bacteriocin [Legionella massiliensis]CDZ77546.1 hypothetical protein BN59_01829 [Legionella massiliensis]CEE13284.1 hypothetical protein BN1094_01829 [Legionella massiliensis]
MKTQAKQGKNQRVEEKKTKKNQLDDKQLENISGGIVVKRPPSSTIERATTKQKPAV